MNRKPKDGSRQQKRATRDVQFQFLSLMKTQTLLRHVMFNAPPHPSMQIGVNWFKFRRSWALQARSAPLVKSHLAALRHAGQWRSQPRFASNWFWVGQASLIA
jgi:hypothetical protein